MAALARAGTGGRPRPRWRRRGATKNISATPLEELRRSGPGARRGGGAGRAARAADEREKLVEAMAERRRRWPARSRRARSRALRSARPRASSNASPTWPGAARRARSRRSTARARRGRRGRRRSSIAALADLDLDPRRLEEVEERLFALARDGPQARSRSTTCRRCATTLAERLAGSTTARDVLRAPASGRPRPPRERYRAAATALGARPRGAAGAARAAGRGRAAAAQARAGAASVPLRAAGEAAWGPEGSTAWRSRSRPTRASPPGRSTGSPRAASCRASCWRSRSCWPRPMPAPTLVFDEVDTGIGGATADAVGERLARLAERASRCWS